MVLWNRLQMNPDNTQDYLDRMFVRGKYKTETIPKKYIHIVNDTAGTYLKEE